jgi:YebC/PmpR family DNA-binding regulatory protein
MSGHSKWSNIKVKKAAEDAKKSKVFAQISKAIRLAVRQSGVGDPNQNPTLRLAVEKARQANMPGENVRRAIDRGLGKGDAGALEEIVYEAFGPGGVGFYIVVQTDNKNRTGSEIRTMIVKAGGSLGGPGSTAYMFQRNGNELHTIIPMEVADEETKEKAQDLFDSLESHDDVEAVYWNASFK